METRYCKNCDSDHQITEFRISHSVYHCKNGQTTQRTDYICKIYKKVYSKINREKLNKYARDKWAENITENTNKRYEPSKNIEKFISSILFSVKAQDKRKNMTIDISKEYLKELLLKQENKCHFCKMTFDIEYGKKNYHKALSIVSKMT